MLSQSPTAALVVVPTAVPVGWLLAIAIVVFSGCAAVGVVTVGRAVQANRRDRRHAAVRDDLRASLFDRLEESDPAWDDWVATLSATERTVTEKLLQDHLERLRGADQRRLRGLGRALGVDERALANLRHGDRFDRRMALGWIALLDVDVSPATLRDVCDHPETRAAAARVLHERGHPAAPTVGTELLLDPGVPLSVLGVDTLYQIHRLDPGPLLERAAKQYGVWPESLLIQVLRVIGAAGPAERDAALEWVSFLFVNDSGLVRAAGATALTQYGWHDEVRNALSVENLIDDPDPRVRAAVYEMLGEWGDDRAVAGLRAALRTESHPQAALVAVRTLGGDDGQPPGLTSASKAACQWVAATNRLQERGG